MGFQFTVDTPEMATKSTLRGFTATITPGVLNDDVDPETLFDNWSRDYDLDGVSVTVHDGQIALTGPTDLDPGILESASSEYPDFGFNPDFDFFRTLARYLTITDEEDTMELISIAGSGTGNLADKVTTYRVSPYRVTRENPDGSVDKLTVNFDPAALTPQWDDPDAYSVYHGGFSIDASTPTGECGFVFEWTSCGLFDNHTTTYINESQLPVDYKPADYATGIESGCTYSVPVVDAATRHELEPGEYTGDQRYELVFNLRACRDDRTNTTITTY